MNILQINTTINSGSTGRIAEDIGIAVIKEGSKSYIAAANTNQSSNSEIIKIGNKFDRKLHGLKTRLFDRHGFGSKSATRLMIQKIRRLNPDIIHLHNIHGYYLNVDILFHYLKEVQLPVVWTFHDCWPITGHCAYFDRFNCIKWQTECFACPAIRGYPASWGKDNSKKNYYNKKNLFNGLNSLQIITPSNWLTKHVENSFLKSYPTKCIHNGIDLKVFNAIADANDVLFKYNLLQKRILLGVASIWDRRKGLVDFIELSKHLRKDEQIVLVGLKKEQIKGLPANITGIQRTENITDLAALYSVASVFINPTYVDNFPTTNLESLACGTPVVTYNTGGSPEAIDEYTGFVVEKGNVIELYSAISKILQNDKSYYMKTCRNRAEKFFNKEQRFEEYIKLYKQLLHG